jgi:hypothetical protein
MIEFNAGNLDELEAEARERAYEVSIAVVTGVLKALDNNVDKVIIGILTNVDLDLTVARTGYLTALETNLVRCEEAEEYELCKEAIIWIKKLKSEK